MAASRRRKRPKGAVDRRGKTAKPAVRGKRTRPIAVMVSVAVVAGGAWMAAYWWRASSAPSVESVPVPENLSAMDPSVAAVINKALAAARQSPGDARAIGHLGRVYHANDFLALAQECYRRAERLDTKTADWPYYIARLAAADGLPQQAREAYERTVALVPDDAAARLGLGQACLDMGELDPAAAAFSRYNDLAPTLPWGHIGLAKIARRRQQFEPAAGHLESACRLDPANPEAHYLLATTYRVLGRNADADRHMQQFEAQDEPTKPPAPRMESVGRLAAGVQAQINVASRLLAREQVQEYAKVEGIYKQVLVQEPANYEALSNLGELYRRQQRYPPAVPVLRKAVALSPTTAYGRIVLAQVYLETHRYAEAEAEAALGLQYDPASVRGLRVLGHARMKRNNFAGAIPPLQSAINRSPKLIQDRFTLALCYQALGQSTEAAVILRELLRLQPAHARAAVLLNQIQNAPRN